MQNSKGRHSAQARTFWIKAVIKARSRCGLKVAPSHRRVETWSAMASQTMPPCILTPDLIGLHLAQVPRPLHQVLMHRSQCCPARTCQS